ncbi:MAG: Sua5/YciO/YrdC/YwlC family protein, partial [Chloroflexota bacterium]
TAQEVLAQLEGRVALVLDGGRTAGDKPSTVVDCTTDQLKILRVGAISASQIERALRQAKVA